MIRRNAIVFGGTGLVGKAVIDELNKSDNYETIRVFVRRKTENKYGSKVKELVVDFSQPESFSDHIRGDDLFLCLGTTIKKAGSVKRMEEIDRDLPVILAKQAFENNVKQMAVISSIGANPSSSNYYLRIKGEMEQEIMKIDFETLAIARPSLLLGEREEKRLGESAGKMMMRILGIFLYGRFRKYRAIESKAVSRALIRILNETIGKEIYESDNLQKLAAGNKKSRL
jgi:uncharacterized protein YbjT (DUF2867 family)